MAEATFFNIWRTSSKVNQKQLFDAMRKEVAASSGDLASANVPVHVAGFSANKTLVRFDMASHLIRSRHAEDDPNAVIYEPLGFLSDADVTVNLVGTDAVLAVHNLPHGQQPLVQT